MTRGRRLILTGTMMAWFAGGAAPALAQVRVVQRGGEFPTAAGRLVVVPSTTDGRSANEVRDDLREVLERHPPTLAQVLRLDPTLLTNESFLAPYPALRTFLAERPEIARAPEFFLSFAQGQAVPVSERQEAWSRFQRLFEMTMVMTLSVAAGLTFVWLVRHALAHRRWLRMIRIQTDLHNRLLERMSSSEEIRAYLQTAATSPLLAQVPTMLDAPRGAPASRILLAVQAGVVLSCAGIGLLLVRFPLGAEPEVGSFLIFSGGLALAVGIGFGLAAAASLGLSRRLGLLSPASRTEQP